MTRPDHKMPKRSSLFLMYRLDIPFLIILSAVIFRVHVVPEVHEFIIGSTVNADIALKAVTFK